MVLSRNKHLSRGQLYICRNSTVNQDKYTEWAGTAISKSLVETSSSVRQLTAALQKS